MPFTIMRVFDFEHVETGDLLVCRFDDGTSVIIEYNEKIQQFRINPRWIMRDFVEHIRSVAEQLDPACFIVTSEDGSDEWMKGMLADSSVTFIVGEDYQQEIPSPSCILSELFLGWGDLTNTCEHSDDRGRPIDRDLWDHEYALDPLVVRRPVSVEPITLEEADALLDDPDSKLTSLNMMA